jgi:phage terminase small subunit
MMAERQLLAPPEGLGKSGQALWRTIVADVAQGWELDARELHLLRRACRCEDELAELEATVDQHGVTVPGSRGQMTTNPTLSEARQLRIVQLRLLGALELSDPRDVKRTSTPAQARARRAAASRWGLVGGG